jgi:hypothetical protein
LLPIPSVNRGDKIRNIRGRNSYFKIDAPVVRHFGVLLQRSLDGLGGREDAPGRLQERLQARPEVVPAGKLQNIRGP